LRNIKKISYLFDYGFKLPKPFDFAYLSNKTDVSSLQSTNSTRESQKLKVKGYQSFLKK